MITHGVGWVCTLYSHYPFDQNAKTFATKGKTFSIICFCILIKGVITVYENYNVIAFKSCIQIFTVYIFKVFLDSEDLSQSEDFFLSKEVIIWSKKQLSLIHSNVGVALFQLFNQVN